MAIFRDERAAQAALDASPIRFALEKVVHVPDPAVAGQRSLASEEDEAVLQDLSSTPPKSGIDEILRPSALLNRDLSSIRPEPIEPASPDPSLPFDPPQSPSAHMKKKWTKQFQITIDRSRAVHADFIERQPYWKQFHPMKSMAQTDLAKQVPHIGLSDVSMRPANAHRTPIRVLKGMNEYVQNRMPTLRGIAEDSENEKAFRQRRGIDTRGYIV